MTTNSYKLLNLLIAAHAYAKAVVLNAPEESTEAITRLSDILMEVWKEWDGVRADERLRKSARSMMRLVMEIFPDKTFHKHIGELYRLLGLPELTVIDDHFQPNEAMAAAPRPQRPGSPKLSLLQGGRSP